MSVPDNSKTLLESGRGTSYWMERLIELNTNTTLTFTQRICAISDYKAHVNAETEEFNQLKSKFQNLITKYECNLQLRDIRRQIYEEVQNRETRIDELIRIKTYNIELAEELHDLRKKLVSEHEKQDKIREKQFYEIYQESMKIFERDPFVIKRNNLKKQIAKKKFDTSFAKQKLSTLNKVNGNLNKLEKQLEEKKIIQLARTMIEYKQKKELERNQSTLNNSVAEKLTVMFENPQESPIVKSSQKVINYESQYNFMFEKYNLFNPKTSFKSSQNPQNKDLPEMNIMQIQLPSLDLLNTRLFETNTNSSRNSKPTEQQIEKSSKQKSSAILNTLAPKLDFLSVPKFDYKLQTITPFKKTSQNEPANQQRHVSKRPAESEESIIKPKLSNIPKYNQILDNMKPNEEERVFLSQPGNRATLQCDNTVMSLSQDSQKSLISNVSRQNQMNNIDPTTIIKENISTNQKKEIDTQPKKKNLKIHSVETIVPGGQIQNKIERKNQVQRTEAKEIEKQNLVEYKMLSLGQLFATKTQSSVNDMFNLKSCASSNKQTSSTNQMTTVQKNVSVRPETVETQKQNMDQSRLPNQFSLPIPVSVDNTPKPLHFPNTYETSKHSETKSPYFPNQPSSQEDRSSLNTSAEQSDKVNISSDQMTSQISAMDSEGIDPNIEQPIEIDNAEYYGDGNDLNAMMPEFDDALPEFTSPPEPNFNASRNLNTSGLPVFLSPPKNQNMNQGTSEFLPTNTFGTNENTTQVQNTGNNFFSFGQSSSEKPGIFNMF